MLIKPLIEKSNWEKIQSQPGIDLNTLEMNITCTFFRFI